MAHFSFLSYFMILFYDFLLKIKKWDADVVQLFVHMLRLIYYVRMNRMKPFNII
jgi:hypothetical protein